jgi:glucuronoarabinoxylan endo-1,4-beta-xylanase
MRAHWAFVSTGEAKYGAENKTKNKLLPRAFVMSHFSKHVTGSTRMGCTPTMTSGQEAPTEYSAYMHGDSVLVVMAIDTTATAYDLRIKLPVKVTAGTHVLSTGNETDSLCQESVIDIEQATKEVIVPMPARSLNTYIFTIDPGAAAIADRQVNRTATGPFTYYDLNGRKMEEPRGLCIERSADGTARKVYFRE